MNHFRPQLLISLGAVMVTFGLFLTLNQPTPARAIESTSAEYVGSQNCAACHKELSRIHDTSRHALTLRDVSSDKTTMRADFSLNATERTVKFPDEDQPRPFTAADVAYVIGSGTHVERYLYRVGRNAYMLLPAEWNVAMKSWQPYKRAAQWPDPAYDWSQNCAGCHATGFNAARGRWVDTGVQCEACHGPGSLHVDLAQNAGETATNDDLNAIRAATVVSVDAQVCGQCHSAGAEPTSKLPFPTNYRPGGALLDAATFALVDPKAPDHWWASGHAKQKNMQFNEWAQSGHGKPLTDLKASPDVDPSCLTCHSADARLNSLLIDAQKAGARKGAAPAPLTLKGAQFGVTCVSCHEPHLDTQKSKLSFNLVSDSYALCVSCHSDQGISKGPHHPAQEIYEGKVIVEQIKPFSSSHYRLNTGPKCVTCHMAKVMVTGAKQSSHIMTSITTGILDTDLIRVACNRCHSNNSPMLMQKQAQDFQAQIEKRLKAARAALKPESAAWVRVVLDAVEGDGSYGLHNPKYVATLLAAAERELGLAK